MEANYKLEEMRQQLDILHRKIEKQTLISEDLLRHTMSDKFSGIQRHELLGLLTTIIMMPLMYHIFTTTTQMSTALIFYTELLLAFGLAMNIFNLKILRSKDFLTDSLKDVYRKIQIKKMRDRQQTIIVFPLIITFFVWFLIELNQKVELSQASGTQLTLSIMGAAIGLIIAVAITIIYNRSVKEIADRLKEFEQ